jgi:hypothetical protein
MGHPASNSMGTGDKRPRRDVDDPPASTAKARPIGNLAPQPPIQAFMVRNGKCLKCHMSTLNLVYDHDMTCSSLNGDLSLMYLVYQVTAFDVFIKYAVITDYC